MLEAEVEKRLVIGVRKLGGEAYKFVSPGHAGVPDRIVVIDGRVVFVELKAEGGRVRPAQKRQIFSLTKHGADVRVLKGPDEVDMFLEELKGAVQTT